VILFVNNNQGILFLSGVTEAVTGFVKIVTLRVLEYIEQEFSVGMC
jgi:hypothetical protein